MNDDRQSADLVLEGGGVKGIGLVGALAVLDERGFRPENVAGTSAGAITAALLTAGYTATELHSLLLELDFERFKDRAWEDRIPGAGAPLSIVKDLGIYEGTEFLAWIRGLLADRDVRTFGDLVHPDFADDPRYRYRLQVIASDLTARRLLVLPQAAKEFGIDPDRLSVAEAVRMSMGIPLFFEPWPWEDAGGEEHLIVDGGVLSNFPVWLFDSDGEPEWPTFGLMLVEPEPRRSVAHRLDGGEGGLSGVPAVVDYLRGLVQTMLEAHDRMYLESAVYARTIAIPTLGVRTTEFDLSDERATELYDSGRTAAEGFLEAWDFDAYIEAYRRGRPRPRRRALTPGGRSPGV